MASINGTKLKIDKFGRIVVPKPLRERLGLKPGSELEVFDQQGGVLLRTVSCYCAQFKEHPALVKVEGLMGPSRCSAAGRELGPHNRRSARGADPVGFEKLSG